MKRDGSGDKEKPVAGTIIYGFELAEEDCDEASQFALYYNPETEEIVSFECFFMHEGINISLEGDNSQMIMEPVTIGSEKGILYFDESSVKTLVWFDERNEVTFVINSDIQKDDILHMARRIILLK